MIDNAVRRLLPHFVGPLLRLYRRLRMTPNQITSLGLATALLASLAVAHNWLILGIIFWWLGRLFDGTDGIYARKLNLQSPFGAYLDFVADMTAYGTMVIAFSVRFPQITLIWSVTLLLYILCGVSALAFGVQEQQLGIDAKDNRGLRLGVGLAEGGETGIAYTLFCFFPERIKILASTWIFVLALTVVLRTVLAYKIFVNSYTGKNTMPTSESTCPASNRKQSVTRP